MVQHEECTGKGIKPGARGLRYIIEHDENEHWWLVEDSNVQVGYTSVGYLMISVDETVQGEESDNTRKE